MTSPIVVRGASGADYNFWACALGAELGTSKGIYILVHEYVAGYWWPHYVGQAKNLNDRAGTGVRHHEKFPAALTLGATHVLAAAFQCDDATLCWIENDIIQALNPSLNTIAPPGFGQARQVKF